MASELVQNVLDSVVAQSLQDARALSVRAQDSAAMIHGLAMQNALALQHQISLAYAKSQIADLDVSAAYRGSHLRKGGETDVQEAAAEGQVIKDNQAATLPQLQASQASQLQNLEAQIAGLASAVSLLIKNQQTTPPQTGGHAAQAPADRAAA